MRQPDGRKPRLMPWYPTGEPSIDFLPWSDLEPSTPLWDPAGNAALGRSVHLWAGAAPPFAFYSWSEAWGLVLGGKSQALVTRIPPIF